MKRIVIYSILLVCTMCAFTNTSNAQIELGFQGGAVNYQGDLVAVPAQFKGTQLGVGLFGRYFIGRHFAARLGVNYGKLVGDDKFYPDYRERQKRNLSFESPLLDVNLMFEISITSFMNQGFDIVYRKKRGGTDKMDLYVFGGAGMFMFNPQAEYDGEMYDLKDYDTELNKPDYATMQLCVPAGIGISFPLEGGWRVGVETSYRFTFTDYIDDVSGYYSSTAVTETIDGYLSDPGRGDYALSINAPHLVGGKTSNILRGNPDNNDGYLFTMVTVTKDVSALFGLTGYKSARHVRYKKGKKYKTGKGYRRKR